MTLVPTFEKFYRPSTLACRAKKKRDRAAMEWLRLVGSIKLYVSFAEYCLFYRALWQKRSFAKETYSFIDPTNQSHPIYVPHETNLALSYEKFYRSGTPVSPSKKNFSKVSWVLHVAYEMDLALTFEKFYHSGTPACPSKTQMLPQTAANALVTHAQVEIFKNQLASRFAIRNDHSVYF